MDETLVELTRGAHVESAHAGAAIVMDAAGGTVLAVGDCDMPVYPRSAVKALLALPLVESGAADSLGLTDPEIALACASHTGEPLHVSAAESMLRKAGRDAGCLECGVHWPTDETSARALVAQHAQPSALHNNCSGKHSGFICLACHRGDDPAGYVQHDHPTMREVTATLADITSARLDERNRAIDGCSIPTYATPLRALALAFARFGSGDGQSPDRATAARRIRAAVAAHPIMVSGSGRFGMRLMTALGSRVFCKSGAEGVFCASLPELGFGLAVKIRDGAGRAAEVATAALVTRFLPDTAGVGDVAAMCMPKVKNWNGIETGGLRPAAALR